MAHEKLTQVNEKLDIILAYVIDRIIEETPIIGFDGQGNRQKRETAIAAYTDTISTLKANIQAYANHIYEKESQLKALMMGLLQNSVLASYTSDNLVMRVVSGTHKGYGDLRTLYACDGVYEAILTNPESYFYNGLSGGATLANLATQAQAAEQTEQAHRDSLVRWLSTVSMHNSFMLLFESPENGRVSVMPRDCIDDIYGIHGALEIIKEFNLDVYIPIRLRD